MTPLLIGVSIALVAAGAASLTLGASSITDLGWSGVWEVRGWRTLAAMLSGAALAIAGCVIQSLFRNPIAEPGVIGVGAGANLGGLSMLALAAVIPGLPLQALIPLAGIAGALAVLLSLAWIARRTDATGVLIGGAVLGLLLSALATLISSMGSDSWSVARALLTFGLGGVEGASGGTCALAVPLIAAGGWGCWHLHRECDLLLSGDDSAHTMGVDVRAVRRWLLIWVALLVAGASALGGAVAFVGLIVPHLMRNRVGAAHARVLPAAAVGGALFVVICDVLVRVLPTSSQIPLGAITSLIGAPWFAWVLLRQRGAR